MNSTSASGSRSIIAIHCLAPPAARSEIDACARTAVAIDALADGIARQKLADPDAVPDELMGNVIALLLSAVSRPAQRHSAA